MPTNQHVGRRTSERSLDARGQAPSGACNVGDPKAQSAQRKPLILGPYPAKHGVVNVAIDASNGLAQFRQLINHLERADVAGMPDFVGFSGVG